MTKIQIVTGLTFNVTPLPGILFSKEFIDKIHAAVDSIVKGNPGVSDVHFDASEKRMFIAFHVNQKLQYKPFLAQIQETLVVLAEHGKDSDLFNELLKRHPNLKEHPQFNRVVGAFDNLRRIVGEVENNESVPVKVEMSRREREGYDPDISRLVAPDSVDKPVQSRIDHRLRALVGQNTDQTPVEQVITDTMPEYYRDKLRKADTESNTPKPKPGDHMNVF